MALETNLKLRGGRERVQLTPLGTNLKPREGRERAQLTPLGTNLKISNQSDNVNMSDSANQTRTKLVGQLYP